MGHERVSPEREGAPADARAEATDELASWVAWQKIGRQALHIEPRTELKRLRDITRECEELVIVETWLAHGRNITRAAEALGVGRRRVSVAVKGWLAPPCSTHTLGRP
jgi:DNA-binding NtrC family response regulator